MFYSPWCMHYGVVDPVRLFGGLRRVVVLRLYTRQGRIVEGELQRFALAYTRDSEERWVCLYERPWGMVCLPAWIVSENTTIWLFCAAILICLRWVDSHVKKFEYKHGRIDRHNMDIMYSSWCQLWLTCVCFRIQVTTGRLRDGRHPYFTYVAVRVLQQYFAGPVVFC